MASRDNPFQHYAVFLLPIMGLAQGAQPIISFNYGARNKERAKLPPSLLSYFLHSLLACKYADLTACFTFASTDPKTLLG